MTDESNTLKLSVVNMERSEMSEWLDHQLNSILESLFCGDDDTSTTTTKVRIATYHVNLVQAIKVNLQ